MAQAPDLLAGHLFGPVAHLVEHLTFNQVVESSILSRTTTDP